MKAITPTVPVKVDPQLLDVVLDELNAVLLQKLTWLDQAYGKVDKYIETKNKKKIITPSIYVGSKKDRGYLKLFPDSHIGNFSFVKIEKQNMDHMSKQSAMHKINFGIVFWFNYENIYSSDHKNRSIENVKEEVFEALDKGRFTTFNMRLGEFIEGADEIYRGFTHNEIDSQFLMRPYGGFEIKGIITYLKQC